MTVLAFDPRRTTNARAIADCATLGYLLPHHRVLDATYGEGRFWTALPAGSFPGSLGKNDIDPTKGNLHYDFTDLPFDDRSWDVVVFDPPYKLNGTPDSGGPASSDSDYGVSVPMRWQERMQLILDGVRECARVADHTLLVKVQDQVCSGKIRWQTHHVLDEIGTWRLVDELYVIGQRKQPEGRMQRHAARNYSTLMVLRR